MVTAQEILQDIQEAEIRWINLQFVDLEGTLRNLSIPSSSFDSSCFSKGITKLDPSGLEGFASKGDNIALYPDPETYSRIPWDNTSCRMFCNLKEPKSGSKSEFDSREVVSKTETTLASTGYTARIGFDLEFFVFDSITVDSSIPFKSQGYALDSREAAWNYYGQNYPVGFTDGYMVSSPKDAMYVFRSNVSDTLEGGFGIKVDSHKHSNSSTGHSSIEVREMPLKIAPEAFLTSKYVIKNVGVGSGLIPTFMPKPISKQKGCALSLRQSLWLNDRNVFIDPSDSSAELSQEGRYYIGGIMDHAPSLCAFTNPTTNSYKRLVGENLLKIDWSTGNSSKSIRVPTYSAGKDDSKHIDFLIPDPSCNPYVAFSATLLAGLDGIKRKIEPSSAGSVPKVAEKKASSKELPRTLWDAVEALRSDNDFIKVSFPTALIDAYSNIKKRASTEASTVPTPWEFKRYLDV